MDTGYLAGLFDGEGCIHIAVQHNNKTRSYGLRVIYCLTNKEIIKKISDFTGFSYCKLKKNNPLWRDAYQIQITGPYAANLLRSMMPYLVVKREEAELAIKLQDHITQYRSGWKTRSQEDIDAIIEYREGIRLQIKALKRIGAPSGMMANSGEIPCPASNGAEGQSRAKQELKLVS